MLQFLAKNRRAFNTIGCLFAMLTVCMMMTACAVPTWLTDAESIIPVVVSGVTSIISFIAALTGNAALGAAGTLIAAWANKVELGIKNIQTLVSEYKSNPSDTLLQDIEQAANLAVGDINALSAIVGIPTAIATKLQAFAQLIVNQLEAWISLIPALKAQPAAFSKMAITVPLAHVDFKSQFNSILATPTGDAIVDAALASTPKL